MGIIKEKNQTNVKQGIILLFVQEEQLKNISFAAISLFHSERKFTQQRKNFRQ